MSRGAASWQGIWATSTPATKQSCAKAGAIRWRDGWPDCSPLTPGSGRSCWSTGWTATRADLDVDLHWQPELWRALVAHIDADPPHIRQQKTVARLREGPSDLPARLSLFGHTRLACTDIELLQALSTHHDLHLWLPHPSDVLWQKLAGSHGAIPRREDTSHRERRQSAARHPRTRPARTSTQPADRAADRRIPDHRRPAQHPARLAAVRHRRQCRSATRTQARGETTARCRCTAATARPVRSMCCARCCSACCKTTRRWSRATSW